jgi:hypothetical protein
MRLQRGGGRGQSIPTVGAGAGGARAPPPPPSLATLGLARGAGDERDRRERAARDGRAIAARRSGTRRRTGRPQLEKAAALEKASGGQAARWMRPQRSHACGSEERNRHCVFYFLEKPCRTEGGAEEAYWARSLRKPGNEPSGHARVKAQVWFW